MLLLWNAYAGDIMQAEPDIMMRTAASGCSLQVVELITVLKYSMSTDLLFSKDSRPVCAKQIHSVLFQLLATLIIEFSVFMLWKVKYLTCNLLKRLWGKCEMSNIFLSLQFWECEVYFLFGEYHGTEGWEVGQGMEGQ